MWEYRAIIGRWLDADTVDVVADLGFHVHMNLRVRLIGSAMALDGYELHGGTAETRALAQQGFARAHGLAAPGSLATIKTAKDTPSGGFDRWLAQVINAEGVNVGDILLAEGLAVEYRRG